MKRQIFSSGGKYEASVGYSRAVRVGQFIFVSGTGAFDTEGNLVGIKDSYAQAKQIILNIESALKQILCFNDKDDRLLMNLTKYSWKYVAEQLSWYFSSLI